MTETPTGTGGAGGFGFGDDRIQPIELQTLMQQSYIDYAMTVIVGRALPDVRDGLKPVHRRILYAMYDGGYRPDRGFSKCSRVVGDVMGQYHPHGDTAIYDTMVRLAQPWVLRYPLIIVDEVGYIPFEPEAANLFFQLVSSRYERASLIVTSNKPFGRWGEVFGDDVVAAAMIDRLVHHAEVINLRGDSYRLKDRDLGRVPPATNDDQQP